MEEFQYENLISDIGIEKGDILDIASGLRCIVQYCHNHGMHFDGSRLLDALQEAVGADGTVMVRAFTWDFCEKIPFDIRQSSSQVGALGNIAMKREDFVRTKHPLYSWMVWGKHQEYLCGLENVSAFGEGTPFDFLYQNDAKLVRIGNLSVWSFTQRHHAEKIANLPFRFEKMFEGEYIDRNGVHSTRKYSMFVRHTDIEVELNDYSCIERDWKDTGVEIAKEWNGINCSTVRLREAMDYVYDDLIHNFGKKTLLINGKAGYESIL